MFNDYCPPSRLHYLIWHTPVASIISSMLIGVVVGVLARWVFGLS